MELNRFGVGDLIMVCHSCEADPDWVVGHKYIIGEPLKVVGVIFDNKTLDILYKTEEDPLFWYKDDWVDEYSVRNVGKYIGVENPKAKTFLEKLEVMENKARENMIYISELDAINILVDAEVENDVDMAQATYVNVNAIERMKELTKKNLAKGDVRGT